MKYYEKMKKDPYEIYIWGVGSFAKDVYLYCKAFSVNVCGFFANIGELPKEYLGLPVVSENELKDKNSVSIIIGHSHYRRAMEWLACQSYIANIYAITRTSYGMWEPVSRNTINNNRIVWEQIKEKCGDRLSLNCLTSYIEALVNDDATCMFDYYSEDDGYFNQSFLKLGTREKYLDVGCYIGGAIVDFYKAVSGNYVGITALEPEQKNYCEAKWNIERYGIKRCNLIKVGAWDRKGVLGFEGDEELGHISDIGKVEVEVLSIDDLRENFSVIKINFGFGISQILEGAKDTIRKCRPRIIVRVGFNEKLIREVFNKVMEINSEYKIYFRYTLGMPEGLTFFAI